MGLRVVRTTKAKVTTITKLAFLQRFTQAERIAIRNSDDPIIIDFLELLSMASEVDVEYPDTMAGVQYLEGSGLIEAGRAAEVLGGVQ